MVSLARVQAAALSVMRVCGAQLKRWPRSAGVLGALALMLVAAGHLDAYEKGSRVQAPKMSGAVETTSTTTTTTGYATGGSEGQPGDGPGFWCTLMCTDNFPLFAIVCTLKGCDTYGGGSFYCWYRCPGWFWVVDKDEAVVKALDDHTDDGTAPALTPVSGGQAVLAGRRR